MAQQLRYKKLALRDQILLRPCMYIGATDTSLASRAWLIEDGAMRQRDVPRNEGWHKSVGEIADNAFDNRVRGTNKVDVSIGENGSITVSNNGETIAVMKHETETDKYNPSVVFGELCCSGQYDSTDANATVVGQNGFGAKLTNIFSTWFEVVCHDPVNGSFKQTFTDNMKTAGPPKITKPKKKPFSTVIKFKLDNSVFKLSASDLQAQHALLHTDLVRRAALFPGVKVSFNGKLIQVRSFDKFAKLFPVRKPVSLKINDVLTVAFGMSDEPGHQSFVNGHYTSGGGTHLQHVQGRICLALQLHFNSKKTSTRVTAAMIKSKLFVFLNVVLAHPKFTSQTKTTLATPLDVRTFAMDSKAILAAAKKCGLLAALEEDLLAKEDAQLSRAISGAKTRSVSVPKLMDATFAGTGKSRLCSLILTEGDSAKTTGVSGVSAIKGGNTMYGVFPLKGKLLNCVAASKQAILKNAEIQNLVKILGLKLNNSYDTVADLSTLRYRHVICLTDADVDGHHIFSLLAAFFATFFPNLLKHGFLQRMITPVLKLTSKSRAKTVLEFYDLPTFKAWEADQMQPVAKTHTVRYLKGLGTSTRAEAKAYFVNLQKYLRPVTVQDDLLELKATVKMLFDPKCADDRKRWLLDGDAGSLDYTTPTQALEEVLTTELKQYHLESLTRAIPSVIDGFKESQRKIVYASLLKFGVANTEFKVAQLGAYAAEKTAYLHAEKSILDTIVKMAQSFVGSNNVPLLAEGGQFGSRLQMGADAASARYIFTSLRPETLKILDPRDKEILKNRCEEGQSIEPEHFMPIVPLVLINGANGIATGFRSLVPSCDPIVVIRKLLGKLQGAASSSALVPYYNGWTGTVSETDTSWVLTGVHERTGDLVTITEIPVGVSTERYTGFLQGLQEAKKIARFTQEHPSENEIRFVIKLGNGAPSDLVKFFNLSATITKSCLNLLDRHGKIKNFESLQGIFDYFYEVRLEYYGKRRAHLILALDNDLRRQRELLRFITAVNAKQIQFHELEHAPLVEKVATLIQVSAERASELLDIKLSRLSKSNVGAIGEKISKLESELETMSKSTAKSLYTDDLNALLGVLKPNKKRKR